MVKWITICLVCLINRVFTFQGWTNVSRVTLETLGWTVFSSYTLKMFSSRILCYWQKKSKSGFCDRQQIGQSREPPSIFFLFSLRMASIAYLHFILLGHNLFRLNFKTNSKFEQFFWKAIYLSLAINRTDFYLLYKMW